MPYVPLDIPPNIDQKARLIVEERVEPFLRDVHALFLLPRPDVPGMDADCALTAAAGLFNLIGGVSQELYLDPWERKKRSERLYKCDQARFEHLLAERFPWKHEPKTDTAIIGKKAAKHIYLRFRNVLTHNLGHVLHRDGLDREVDLREVIVAKGHPLSDDDLT